MRNIDLRFGDNRTVLPTIPANSVDSIITDSPYGLSKEPDMTQVLRHWLNGDDYTHKSKGFMGESWDSFVPGPATWKECLRILKPGGYLLSFFGSRTYDMGTLAIRLAGFEIRDQIMWIYSQGYPKSHNLKGENQGKGTALKPSHEPIVVARKPLVGTVLDNVNRFGTGTLNIDLCRIDHQDQLRVGAGGLWSHQRKNEASKDKTYIKEGTTHLSMKPGVHGGDPAGRWPANIIHDGSEAVLAAFDAFGEKVSGKPGRKGSRKGGNIYGSESREIGTPMTGYGDSGSIARFFYCAKADKVDREEGLRGFELQVAGFKNDSGRGISETDPNKSILRRNICPTVKPTTLMRYLCRLVTPEGGTVADPFMGSGTTGKAAVMEGFGFLGIEDYYPHFQIGQARITHAAKKYKPQLTIFSNDTPAT